MNLLEKHFDLAFAAPDGIQKLRELILTLAMQGKLVPQDPDDEPASELLRAIEVEKQRLVKEGKIKQPKPLSAISSEEIPYELPKKWKWMRLEDISTKIHYGYTASANHDLKDIRLLRITDIQDNKVDWESVPGCEIKEKDVAQYLLANKDILIARTGGTVGKSYLVENISVKAVFASYLIRVVPSEHIDVNYLKLFIECPLYWKQLYAKCSGTGQPNVNGTSLSTLLLPLPSFAEQHRIVAKIDRLMARCDELEKLRAERNQKRITIHTAALNRLLTAKGSNDFSTAWRFITQHFGELYSVKENVAELRKAILQLAVMGKLVPQDPKDEPASELLKAIELEKQRLAKEGKIKQSKPLPEIKPEEVPYGLPKGWRWCYLDDILVFGPTNGFSPKAVDYETPVRSLTLSATTSGKFKGEYSKFISNNIPPDSDLWLRDGDILVQRGNTLEYVGVPAVYRGGPNHFIYPDLMMKLRVSSEIDTNFVYLAMSSDPSRDFLRSRASGTSGTMPKINQTTLKSLPIPIPPLAEQHRIVAKIDQLMALCDYLDQQIDAAASKQTTLLNAVMAQV